MVRLLVNRRNNPVKVMLISNPDDFIVPKCHEEIEILYRDECILLINKPTKLLSLSGKHPANLDSVHYRLVQDFPSALMIHRLDLGTSGIMIIALNKAISAKLNRQFSERRIKKSYTALLAGHMTTQQGKINLPIAKGEFPYQKICQQTGKAALSDYKLVGLEGYSHQGCTHPISRVTYQPLTGRTHQLRIHSQQMGHPILGCDLYPSNDGSTTHFSDRLMLHASSLEFEHPESGELIKAHCPSPF